MGSMTDVSLRSDELAESLVPVHLSGRTREVAPPKIRWNSAEQVKKGEDFHTVHANCGEGSVNYGVYGIFDGHNGPTCAKYVKKHLKEQVERHLPPGNDVEAWHTSLPTALAEGFLMCHDTFAKTGELSGSTVTLLVVSGWMVTVGAVGDSRAILDTTSGGVQDLTVDHRFEDCKEERQRVLKQGGMIARLRTFDGEEVGPLRSWPGGLCVSRSIGDIDCGAVITCLPHVRQIVVPSSGGRIIIASDGLWDALSSEKVASSVRGLPGAKAAAHLIKESVSARGLRDDITVVVIDLLPASTRDDDVNACPVQKAKPIRKAIFSKFMKKGKKGQVVEDEEEEVSTRLPSLVHDHDSIKGGNLYERYLKCGGPKPGGSVHVGGLYCSVCGAQVIGEDDAEASIRGGKSFCAKHIRFAAVLAAKGE